MSLSSESIGFTPQLTAYQLQIGFFKFCFKEYVWLDEQALPLLRETQRYLLSVEQAWA